MTPIDRRLAEAWMTGAPALHREAELLAAEGVAEPILLEALERLMLAVRAYADDDRDDLISDVMERFTDWCRDENRIRIARVPVPTSPPPSRG
jgi:hypothetical protein